MGIQVMTGPPFSGKDRAARAAMHAGDLLLDTTRLWRAFEPTARRRELSDGRIANAMKRGALDAAVAHDGDGWVILANRDPEYLRHWIEAAGVRKAWLVTAPMDELRARAAAHSRRLNAAQRTTQEEIDAECLKLLDEWDNLDADPAYMRQVREFTGDPRLPTGAELRDQTMPALSRQVEAIALNGARKLDRAAAKAGTLDKAHKQASDAYFAAARAFNRDGIGSKADVDRLWEKANAAQRKSIEAWAEHAALKAATRKEMIGANRDWLERNVLWRDPTEKRGVVLVGKAEEDADHIGGEVAIWRRIFAPKWAAPDDVPEVQVKAEWGIRAWADEPRNVVKVTPNSKPGVVLHELTHHTEYHSPDLQQARREFYERRTAGDPLKPLSELTGVDGYRADEVGRRDKWLDDMIYAGKDYSDTDAPWASEVVTLGVQAFLEDPAQFAKRDPEFFDWIYQVVVLGK